MTVLTTQEKANLLQDALSQVREALQARIAFASPLCTADWVKKYLPHYVTKSFSELHYYLCARIDTVRETRGLKSCVVAPRGNAKSTFYSLVLPLRNALENKDKYILLAADTVTQSEAYMAAIKFELEQNEAIAEDYPNVAGEGVTWREDRIVLRNGVKIEAVGTGSKIRGRRRLQARPSLVIVDDPENDEHRDSARQREKSWGWLQRALLKVGNKLTNYVVVGTAIHRECIALRLTQTPGWEARVFAAIQVWPKNMDLWEEWKGVFFDFSGTAQQRFERSRTFYDTHRQAMDEGSQVLWPDEEDLYTLMCMWAEDSVSFDSEKQGNPINPEACEWPATCFDYEGFWFREWPDEEDILIKVMAQDPSKGNDAKKGDYTCNFQLVVTKSGTLYVDCDMKRRPIEDMIRHAARQVRQFQPVAFALETNLFQELLVKDYLRIQEEEHTLIPVIEIINNVRKEVRIRRWTPYLMQKRVRFKANSPGAKMLVEQLKDFPNGAHDDGPDAGEMAIRTASSMISGEYEESETEIMLGGR